MRKLAVVAAFLVSAQAPYVPTAPQAPILNVEISVTTQGGGKPAFYGTTNLPDGFEALAELGAGGRILGQDHIVVHAHHFTAGPFSNGNNPFPSGTYSFSIEVSASRPSTGERPQSHRREWLPDARTSSSPHHPGRPCISGPHGSLRDPSRAEVARLLSPISNLRSRLFVTTWRRAATPSHEP